MLPCIASRSISSLCNSVACTRASSDWNPECGTAPLWAAPMACQGGGLRSRSCLASSSARVFFKAWRALIFFGAGRDFFDAADGPPGDFCAARLAALSRERLAEPCPPDVLDGGFVDVVDLVGAGFRSILLERDPIVSAARLAPPRAVGVLGARFTVADGGAGFFAATDFVGSATAAFFAGCTLAALLRLAAALLATVLPVVVRAGALLAAGCLAVVLVVVVLPADLDAFLTAAVLPAAVLPDVVFFAALPLVVVLPATFLLAAFLVGMLDSRSMWPRMQRRKPR